MHCIFHKMIVKICRIDRILVDLIAKKLFRDSPEWRKRPAPTLTHAQKKQGKGTNGEVYKVKRKVYELTIQFG